MSKTVDALRHNRGLTIAGVLVVVVSMVHPAVTTVKETRFARDAMMRTPFHSVVVTSENALPDGAELSGEMVKRRCVYSGLTAYVRVDDVWRRAYIDVSHDTSTSPGGDRPNIPEPQLWGPWKIVWYPPPVPSEWAIYAHHNCPEGPHVNKFASGDWP